MKPRLKLHVSGSVTKLTPFAPGTTTYIPLGQPGGGSLVYTPLKHPLRCHCLDCRRRAESIDGQLKLSRINNPLKARCAQALQDMRNSGVSVSQWARDNGYSRDVAASVLYGRSACLHGMAHEVAVALGIKQGRVVKPGSFRPRVKAHTVSQVAA